MPAQTHYDKSFNASAYKGLMEAKAKFGLDDAKIVEAMDDNAFEPALRNFAKKNYDLIVGIGIAQADAMKKVAAAFPDKKFAIVDAEVNAPNVRSLLFQEHEGSYLMGVLAGLKSASGKTRLWLWLWLGLGLGLGLWLWLWL
jgi:basic membrane protein A